VAADRLYLVFSLPNHPGVPVYLHRTAEVSDGTRGVAPTLKPVFDDDIQQSQVWTNAEFAVQARDHWRSRGFKVSLFDREGNGPLFEGRDQIDSLAERPVQHSSRFVALTGGGVDGLGYFIRFSPERKQWYCRADMIPSMLAEHRDKETLWSETAESVVQKILDIWTLSIAVPFEDPQAAARAEQDRQRTEQQKQFRPGIRPGDRR
jgi:hypothetical protein